MSNDDYLRRSVEEALRNNPQTQKVTEQQVPNYHDRTTINNHMDKVRADQSRSGRS